MTKTSTPLTKLSPHAEDVMFVFKPKICGLMEFNTGFSDMPLLNFI
ncbi:hypothetical protein ATK78_2202 [Pedobacter metabolipauper]|uniref:Uncharacterized protein n=1 Tax=Pedobacter metabolipauper TaxID=425513 RepID=A0A4R6SXU8_9SPHI|nr:hypothetical protein ATK78_2202 [Pedobacter metabolipauper]